MSDRNRRVWEVLRDQGPMLARDLAQVLDIPRAAASSTLHLLERKGTVTMVGERVARQPALYAALGEGCARAVATEIEAASVLLDGLTRCWGVKREELQGAA